MTSRLARLLTVGALALTSCARGGDPAVTGPIPQATPTSTSTSSTTTTTTTTAPPAEGPPRAAADPPGLAAQIVTSRATIANGASTAAQLELAGHTEQVAYKAIATNTALLEPVLALIPGDQRAAVAANVNAGWLLRSTITKPKDTLPDWSIVRPEPIDELLSHYQQAGAEFGLPWQYLAAIHLVETRMGRIRGVSSAGAQGPMQFLPKTWAAYGGGGDINSYRDAIRAAARYLKANGAPGDMRTALWNYNHTYKYVDAVTQYAEQMRSNPRAIYGYYFWQVYYRTSSGDVLLPEGWTRQ